MQHIEVLRLQELQNKLIEISEDELGDYRSGFGNINTKQLSLFKDFHIRKEYALEDEQTVQLRRTAYRKAIGVKDVFNNISDASKFAIKNVIFPNSHETKLMRIQRKVIERYYGNHFDGNDADTWTKQVLVVEWLKQEYGLSEREAKAIDMITRPDIARGK